MPPIQVRKPMDNRVAEGKLVQPWLSTWTSWRIKMLGVNADFKNPQEFVKHTES